MKKAQANWIKDAPRRDCSTCKNAKHEYVNYRGSKYTCKKHDWITKAMAICDDYDPS